MPTSDQSNWIGIAKNEFSGTNSNWMRFSTPFNYMNNSTPSFMLSVISSGDSTIAIDGSELLIDDLTLVYNTNSNVNVSSALYSKCELWFNNDVIYFKNLNINNEYLLKIYDLTGKNIVNRKINSADSNYTFYDLRKGIYVAELYNINNNERKIIKIRR